jgi:hypothetical protein
MDGESPNKLPDPNKVPPVKAPDTVEGAGCAAKSWLTLLITILPVELV